MLKPWISNLVVFSLVWGASLSGCVKVEPPKPALVETIAVLPFDNESNDVNAADILQTYVYLALKPSVYRVMDIKEVNEKLAKVGIVDGGQLAAVDPVKLGKDLGVQALMFGDVATFRYTNIGFYVERKVTLELKLVDVTTGNTLWENEGTMANRKLNLNKDDVSKELVKGLADQLVDKLFNTPLEEEAQWATIKTLTPLPGFIFSGFAKGENSPNNLKRMSRDIFKGQINQK